jgi:hypothetical protein
MKATLEIPDDLFKRSKAAATTQGESLDEFVTEALREHLRRQAATSSGQRGWRSVFGQATQEEVASVNALIAKELERTDPDDWR